MNETVLPGQKTAELEIRPIVAADAPGLTQCLVRCYGTGYAKRVLYDHKATAALISAGEYDGVVAATNSEIVGHIGLVRPTPRATLFEAGTTIVDERFRGTGLMRQMSNAMVDMIVRYDMSGFITSRRPPTKRCSAHP